MAGNRVRQKMNVCVIVGGAHGSWFSQESHPFPTGVALLAPQPSTHRAWPLSCGDTQRPPWPPLPYLCLSLTHMVCCLPLTEKVNLTPFSVPDTPSEPKCSLLVPRRVLGYQEETSHSQRAQIWGLDQVGLGPREKGNSIYHTALTCIPL